MQPRPSKSRQIELFNSWLPGLSPPCGCEPVLVQCQCINANCDCEILEITFVDPDSGKACKCRWKDDAIIARLVKLLCLLDPGAYSDRVEPRPSVTASKDERIRLMRRRQAKGFALRHPADRKIEADSRTCKLGDKYEATYAPESTRSLRYHDPVAI